MKRYFDNFVHDYDPEICESCPYHKVHMDWDEGGPERVGGMAPTRVEVHTCGGTPTKCAIETYKGETHGS